MNAYNSKVNNIVYYIVQLIDIFYNYFAGFKDKCLKKFVGYSMVLLYTAAFTLGLPFGLMVVSGNALIQNNLHNFAFNV